MDDKIKFQLKHSSQANRKKLSAKITNFLSGEGEGVKKKNKRECALGEDKTKEAKQMGCTFKFTLAME